MQVTTEDNFQFSYQRLLLFLSRPGEQGYIFCRADDLRFIPVITTTLVTDLGAKGVRAKQIYLQKNTDEPLLYQVEKAAVDNDAVIVANLFEIVDQTQEGLACLTQLNFAREALWQINKPILFWADSQSMNIIANHAPDLYSQRRHTTVHFTGTADVAVAPMLQKEGWETFLSSQEFKDIETNINILEKRLRGAKEATYPAMRSLIEIALPLANNYAKLGLKEEAKKLLKEYEAVLKTLDDEHALRELAKVYYSLHNYDYAIQTLHSANDLITRKQPKGIDIAQYPEEWFLNLVDIADWSAEIGKSETILPDLIDVAKILEEDNSSSSANDRTLAVIQERLGVIMEQSGHLRESLKYYEQSLKIREHLREKKPLSAQLMYDLSVAFDKVGNITEKLGNLNEARKYYEQSLKIGQQLCRKNPSSEQFQRGLSVSLVKMGNTMRTLGNLTEAVKYYEQFLNINKQLSNKNPLSEPLQRDLGVSFEKLGDTMLKLDNLNEAHKYYNKSINVREQLYSKNPISEILQRDVAVSYTKIAFLLQKEGNSEAALKYCKDSLSIFDRLSAANPLSNQLKVDVTLIKKIIAEISG